MAGVPIVFRDKEDKKIVSYDWVDLASGMGVVEFEGYQTRNSVSQEYVLGTNPFETAHRTIGNGSGTYNYEFDTAEFNMPSVISGKLTLGLLQAIWTGGGTATMTHTIEFFHYDGSTETSLAAAQTTKTLTHYGGATTHVALNCMLAFDIPETNFKKGDILRMKIQQNNGGSGGYRVYVTGTDPLNRDIGINTTTLDASEYPTWLKLAIPFRINL